MEVLLKELRKREPASLKVFVSGGDPVPVKIGEGRYRWRNAAELCESYSYDRIEGYDEDGRAVMNFTPPEDPNAVDQVDQVEDEDPDRFKVRVHLSQDASAMLEGQRLLGENIMQSFRPLFDAQNQLVQQLTHTVAGLVQSHVESLNLLREAAYSSGRAEAREETDTSGGKKDEGFLGGIGNVLEGLGKLQTENPKMWEMIMETMGGSEAPPGGNGAGTNPPPPPREGGTDGQS